MVEQLVKMFENFGFLTRCTQNWWGRAIRVNYKPYMDIAVKEYSFLSGKRPTPHNAQPKIATMTKLIKTLPKTHLFTLF